MSAASNVNSLAWLLGRVGIAGEAVSAPVTVLAGLCVNGPGILMGGARSQGC